MTADTDHVSQRARIERQRRLPFTKAIQISLKSIKVRFWRSMLTAGSIILAIAFLMSQLTSAEIVRALEETANKRVRVNGANKWLVDEDAADLKKIADQRDSDAKQLVTDLQPILDAYDTAERRLAAGKALAAVAEDAEIRRRLKDTMAELARARKALNDEAVQAARLEYETDDAERQRLERRLRATNVTSARESINEALKAVKARLKKSHSAYKDYVRKHSEHQQAAGRVTSAEKRLAAAERAAAEAHTAFPDQSPAPEGSEELDRLEKTFRAAKRKNDRAEKRIASAENRAERAKKRHEAATRKALKELLAKQGGQTGDAAETKVREIELPLGLTLTSTRLWIISLALLVCLVGITNAMLMSVTERYREIGTMKCLGALDSFIIKIFLLESSFVGILGVLLGVVLGFGLTLLVQLNNFGTFVTRYFPGSGILKWTVVAIAVGAVLSALGGILPARRAARMTPVQAMRVEE